MTERTSRTLTIDGSQGEGGGQILRSSLALSMATGIPFRITKIRAKRPKPGLMRQHLACVKAAEAVSSAQVSGAVVGSQELTFAPRAVKAGDYHFPIGSAGGTTLVLQAILPALLRADGRSTLVIEGGTHNRASPPFEFLERALCPLLQLSGASVRVRLESHGFYPSGGGRIVVEVEPTHECSAVDLTERGTRLGMRAGALVSRLPRSIARRELEVLRDLLELEMQDTEIVDVSNPIGAGNIAFVELRHHHVTEVFSAFGEIGKSSEQVARELAKEVQEYLAHPHPIGNHLADQLMVPLALLEGGRYSTGPLTEHSRTNIDIVKAFGGQITLSTDGIVQVHPLR